MTTPQNHTPDPLSPHVLAEVARLQAENTAMREVLALGRRVMDGLMAESNNDYSVWEGKSISDRWFELRDEFRARLNTAGAVKEQG